MAMSKITDAKLNGENRTIKFDLRIKKKEVTELTKLKD